MNGIYTNHIFRKKDFMNKMMKMLALGAMGVGGFMLYKKYNPDYKKDIKKYVDKMADRVNKMNENMM